MIFSKKIMENHRKFLLTGGIIIGASLVLFLISFQFYAIPTANTPSDLKVVIPSSPLTLATDLEKNQEASMLAQNMLPRDVLLNAEIKDPNGAVVFNENFEEKILTSFTPSISGKYTLVVIPLSDKGTTVWATFGDPTVVSRMDNVERAGDILGPEFELFGYAGIGLFFGIIMLIIGGIQTLRFKINSKRRLTEKEFN